MRWTVNQRIYQRPWGAALVAGIAMACLGAEETPQQSAAPATRPEMKAALQALKDRQPRIPLPQHDEQEGVTSHLPPAWGAGPLGALAPLGRRGGRDRRGNIADPRGDAQFTDPSFWVVSRANDCRYCLSHQELKLRAAGMDEDSVAALDCDWSIFRPSQRAILTYARKLTLEPYAISDQDLESLTKHLSDQEIIELTINVSQFNALNRWTQAMGFPREASLGETGEDILATPTSERFQRTTSVVTPGRENNWPPLLGWADAWQALEKCRRRQPRVDVPGLSIAAETEGATNASPLWNRALASVPQAERALGDACTALFEDAHLDPRLKAELSLTSALHNRAWYAAGRAMQRLVEAGATRDAIEEYVAAMSAGFADDKPAHRLAVALTKSPQRVADDDVAELRRRYGDQDAARILYVICVANFFDRFTEALGLPLESTAIPSAR